MCLAVPAKVIEIKGNHALVDYGDGTMRLVNVSLVDAKLGQYVLVHTGFAIEVINEKEAKETMEIFNEMFS